MMPRFGNIDGQHVWVLGFTMDKMNVMDVHKNRRWLRTERGAQH